MNRLTELQEKHDVHDDDAFHRLVQRAFELLELTDEDVAHGLDMSRPSVTRWRNGKSAPHPAMRPRVFRFFARHASHRATGREHRK